MKPSRSSDEAILGVLKGPGTGASVVDTCSRHRVRDASACNRNAGGGGMENCMQHGAHVTWN